MNNQDLNSFISKCIKRYDILALTELTRIMQIFNEDQAKKVHKLY